ncbi:DsbE family thiol:disulfide interchange protein [Methylocystis heyeri]|uniref:DsbE family thiol:disulfide interchange protein n=1 Tax=Methylocystis heyeri TaxID=391905 RepID=A0A6B8KMH6_9HYPH|nr:DsbE family thiol:disulfide interchange protein [Methylocystis heyeri]
METGDAGPARRSLLRLLPLVVFLLLAAVFLFRLFAGDASRLPSALIGRPAPPFTLPAVQGLAGVPGFSDDELRQGHVSIVNIFASWCGPCHQEHATLMAIGRDAALKEKGVRLYGLSYKDEAPNAVQFLTDGGNPYAAVGADLSGRTAIDFGVYGVPETFIIKGDGTVAYKYVGPLSAQAFALTLLPEIEKAMK